MAVNGCHLFLFDHTEGYEKMQNTYRKIVDVRDVAEALVLVNERPDTKGRNICTAHMINTEDLVNMLRSIFPNFSYPKSFAEGKEVEQLSSEKLQRLGWSYRPLEETLVDSIESYRLFGILD
ncbi:hypothetical protein RJ639_025022 [Escallonia herrerae]|uniref:Uncharacterized protein n=1 Tax=Escallonia herrerae TaxID=1293975 RepID=A0AA88S3N5_9ASTE|nr:hypothetical protein RJ639_025022 [Escallonia herrerae]